ncbi:MAG: molybdate ABC transporter substrate-binding protein, partial [Deltaproteobacteria bacterium]|nr:molybdate ABC transporter substrate-binding protein [Deltaproteobacteria bacterium]
MMQVVSGQWSEIKWSVVSDECSEWFRVKGIVLVFFLLVTGHWSLTTEVWAEPKTLTIAAAADLSFALKEIVQGFEREKGIKVILSFGSSGLLAQQIENGAPFDAFFSANAGYIERLKGKGLIISGSETLYARGRIVLAVNRASGIKVERLEDLLNPNIRKVAIANPNHAPYGQAAKEALKSLNLWDRLIPKLVYGE